MLVISSSVHLVNYYRDAVREHGSAGAASRGLSAGWLPCTLAAVTTSVGMLSLLVSQIEPVRAFGLFSAIGVTCRGLVRDSIGFGILAEQSREKLTEW